MIGETQRIKIVTKNGPKLCHLLERKDPFVKNCESGECPPCQNNEQGKLTKCKKNNICYESKCILCEKQGKTRVYTG